MTLGPYPVRPIPPTPTPAPGDPDGLPHQVSTELARGMRMEWLDGWEFRTTSFPVGGPVDLEMTPPGDGWELNEYAGHQGHSAKSTPNGDFQLVHWRRRTPGRSIWD